MSSEDPACAPENDESKDENSDSLTISEHLSSIENDRSMEFEVMTPQNFTMLPPNLPGGEAMQETQIQSMDDTSFVSLKGLQLIIDQLEEPQGNLHSENFNSGTESTEDSLNIFAHVDLSDKTLGDRPNDSFNYKDGLSNQSISLGTSTTEYKQFQEDLHSRFNEYHKALSYKDEQIEKLTQSLQKSVISTEEMKQHLQSLQEELRKKNHLERHVDVDLNNELMKLESAIKPEEIDLFNSVKISLNNLFNKSRDEENHTKCEGELKALREKLRIDRSNFESEIELLRAKINSQEFEELRSDLDAKHSKEMEELRTYFEKKCADLEKNYSDEILSRKLSGSSSLSETELPSDFVGNCRPGPGGDAQLLDLTKNDVIKLAGDLNNLYEKLNEKNLHSLDDQELGGLRYEIDKFLSDVRADLQNKYHAELEILREDFENRIDELKLSQQKQTKEIEQKYCEIIEDLNAQLRGRVVSTAQQEIGSGDFEIDEVVQSYERRLQEQVNLAKIDIITALENQIQRLAASDDFEEEWPDELLRLKERFGERYRSEMAELSRQHEAELARLRAEHDRSIERTRRHSLRDSETNKTEIEVLRERDHYKQQIATLRNLIGELFKYFTRCEDELNSTLVDELINKTDGSTRVRLAPNLDVYSFLDGSGDTSDLQGELGTCLENLRSDANAILALTSSVGSDDSATKVRRSDSDVGSLTRRLIDETRIKTELNEQLAEARSLIQTLQNDRDSMETNLEQLLERQKCLEHDLGLARCKIAEFIENGHREIISEGYGEGQNCSEGMSEAVGSLQKLQQRARNVLDNPENHPKVLLELIEELARIGERIVDEAKKEKDDLKLQIEAADKKYKTTCRFLEEQAAEREQERDEAQKRIDSICQQLKGKDKDRASWERYTNELEQLETQLREQSKVIESLEERCQATERERCEAVDKISELRDIIRHLEEHIRIGNDGEVELRNAVAELEALVKNRNGSEDVVVTSEEIGQLREYIVELEGEVQRLRLGAEIAGEEGTLQQIRIHLCDFETTLDKQTKDLECLHAISTTCSSPSEDMSIRDVLHQNLSSAIYDECEVPLQQLARLREKLLRHSRAEDAAVKRIKDLEMHICALRTDLEECQNDRELLKKQISDHLVLISNLQIRLDEQRIRAEHMEKHTNTSLEVQNYDLKNTIMSLEEKIAQRDKTIVQLKANMEETRRILEQREKELSTPSDLELITHMQSQIEHLRAENSKLKSKLDESSEVERLRERLAQTERKLDDYLNLSLDANQLEELSCLKLSGVSLRDLLDMEMRRQSRVDEPISPIFKHNQPEVSKLESMFHSLQIPVIEQSKKHVRFEDEILHDEIVKKNELIADYEGRLTRLDDVEAKLTELTKMLAETETNLKKTTQDFEAERRKEKEALVELGVTKTLLQDKDNDIKQLTSRLEEMRKQFEGEVEELRAEIEQKQSEIDRINLELSKEKEASTEMVQNLADLRNKSEEMNNLKVVKDELNNELLHYQSLLAEKEKIIEQMSIDSKSLHVSLETIQSKMQETGNIIDLSRKLREEQKKTARLSEQLELLQTQLSNYNDKKSLETIADQVKHQLDYSARLDDTLLSAVGTDQDLQSLNTNLKRQKLLNKQLVRAKESVEKQYNDLLERTEHQKINFNEEQARNLHLIEELRVQLDRTLDGAEELRRELLQVNSAKMALEKQKRSDVERQSTTFDSLLREQVALLEKQVEQLTIENKELRRKIEAAVRDKSEESMKKQLNKVMAEREATAKKYEHVRQLLEEIDTERKSLKNQLASLNEKLKNPQIPEALSDKIKDLRNAVNDNVQMMELVTRLTNEKRVLEERIDCLENATEFPFDDAKSRANYLFAKYLRVDSYRKALCYQKRYLLTLLGSAQPVRAASSPLGRFRAVALVIVSTIRMRLMVRRWHSGKRLAMRDRQRARFHVGQPVSSQNFTAANEMPWMGSSPPSKDSHRIGDGTPLASPGLLNIYVERVNQIQERLGLDSGQ